MNPTTENTKHTIRYALVNWKTPRNWIKGKTTAPAAGHAAAAATAREISKRYSHGWAIVDAPDGRITAMYHDGQDISHMVGFMTDADRAGWKQIG